MQTTTAERPVLARSAQSTWQKRILRFVRLILGSPTALLGAIIILFWVTMAVFGPLVAPYGIQEIERGAVWHEPSADHWMGTDNLGRDIFSRVLVGARLMVLLPTVSIASAAVIGTTIGLFSGYMGGWIDEVMMRVVDLVMAFPVLMLYLIIIVAVGASAVNVVFAITLGTAPAVARLARGLVLDLRTREFVLAAKMRGESTFYILFREILPNAYGPILVDALVRVGYASFAVGAFGFLGLGVPEPHPDWGRMVANARSALVIAPTAPLFPALCIASLVIAYNLMADGLSEAD